MGGAKSQEQKLRVALVCDWLTTPGGAEKVLLALHRLYPEAPIYTSQYRRKGIDWFTDAEVRTGWLQVFPAGLRKFLGPLRQIYFGHLDLSNYDLVISVTGAEAKAVRTKSRTHAARHLCYCHVPTQYYWQMYDQYIENPGFGILNPLVRLGFKLLVKPLRRADYLAAQQPDQFVTISNYAKEQIKQYYRRDAVVIAPPVEVEKFGKIVADSRKELLHKFSTHNVSFFTGIPQEKAQKSTKNDKLSTSYPQVIHKKHEFAIPPYYIIACRQVTWKRVDLAVQACVAAQVPLLVVGDGPEYANLVKLAGGSELVQFAPWATTEDLALYLQQAKGYLFPSLEPFGIAAVEALAAGCPVIAYEKGGSRDFVIDGKNGVLFGKQTVESMVRALRKFDELKFNRAQVVATAQRFAVSEFERKIEQAVQRLMDAAQDVELAAAQALKSANKTTREAR